MIDLIREASGVQELLEKNGWKFCFIGGVALLRWGEPRFTADMDLSLLTGFGGEEKFVDTLLGSLKPRLPDMRNFALQNRILLLWSKGNIPIDIALSGVQFEETMISSSTKFEFAQGYSLRTCGAEDLVVLKAFADREKDWEDVKGILVRQGSRLRWDYVIQQLEQLCEVKGNKEIIKKLEKMKPLCR